MAAGDVWTVNVSELNVRSEPSVDSAPIGALLKGNQAVELARSDDGRYVKIEFYDQDGNTQYGWLDSGCMTVTPYQDIVVSDAPKTDDEDMYKSDSQYIDSVPDTIFDYSYNNSLLDDDDDFLKINKIAGVFGLPYQFLPNTDPRLSNSASASHIGYEYADKIVTNIPLLFIAPGKPAFMKQYSKSAKTSIIEKLVSVAKGSDSDKISLNNLLEESGRYYTFEYDQTRYYKFVNPMCRIAARYMNVQDVQIDGKCLDNIDWKDFTQSRIKSLGDLGGFSSIPFYVDADTSVSESFSNDTTQSLISSTVNSISDMGREINFLLGYGGSALDVISKNADVASEIDAARSTIEKLIGGNNFLGNLANHLTTVAAGGRLIFPEIWSDSSFSRSYSCRFKFISPDPSNLSVYLNVIVPLLHLLGLVAPQSVEMNPNGYTSPFIVRAIYKGIFNIDMGIIQDMSVTKGAECQWTPNGIPTSIEVSITIKDLYSVLSITPTTSNIFSYDTMNNTALMDYIANLCGINIYKPEMSRLIDMWYVNNISNRATDIPSNIWSNIQQKVQNSIMGIFRR